MASLELPWLKPVLENLVALRQSKRLPHALLLAGPVGIGKSILGHVFANHLLCREESGCGECKDCHLVAAGSHPDVRLVSPEEDSKQIKIEQVRNLIDWVNQTPQIAQRKVAILNPAHAMNRNSANALLKVMEEPPANTYLVLVSSEPARLLPTIRSRAQTIQLLTPPVDLATEWLVSQGKAPQEAELLLRLSGGAPVSVVEEYDESFLDDRRTISHAWKDLVCGQSDVINLVSSLAKLDPEKVVQVGLSVFQDVARQHLTLALTNEDLQEDIVAMAAHVDSRQALGAVSRLEENLRLLKGSQNPNKTLLLEQLMLDCQQVSFGL